MSRHRHHRPEGETNRERRLQRIVALGVVVLFILIVIIGFEGWANYQSQTAHHATTTKQQNTIIAQNTVIERQGNVIITAAGVIKTDTAALVAYHAQTVALLNQIDTLQAEFTSSVGQIPAVAAALKAGQQALVTQLNDIDNRVDSLCAHLPATVCPS